MWDEKDMGQQNAGQVHYFRTRFWKISNPGGKVGKGVTDHNIAMPTILYLTVALTSCYNVKDLRREFRHERQPHQISCII